jgi:hypothetical protein
MICSAAQQAACKVVGVLMEKRRPLSVGTAHDWTLIEFGCNDINILFFSEFS